MNQLFIAAIASLIVMLSIVGTDVQAVTCNKCNSLEDQHCTSTLGYEPPTCTDDVCFTFTGTASGGEITATLTGDHVIIRDCLPSSPPGILDGVCAPMQAENDHVTLSGTYCFCESDYCNGGAIKPAPINPYVGRTTAVGTRLVNMHPTVVPTVKDVAALTATNAAPAKSVTCYECNSYEEPSCGSTITYKPPTCTGTACATFTGRVSDRIVIIRDCATWEEVELLNGECLRMTSQVAVDVQLIGNVCHCVSNYCNGDASNSPRPSGISLNNQLQNMAHSRNAATATWELSCGWSMRFIFAFVIWLDF